VAYPGFATGKPNVAAVIDYNAVGALLLLLLHGSSLIDCHQFCGMDAAVEQGFIYNCNQHYLYCAAY